MSSVVVPVLLRGLRDPLPNVRLSAARVADDILSVAAMSSWPPPGGRRGGSPAGATGPPAGEEGSAASGGSGRVEGDGNGGDVLARGGGAGSGGGGEWWGCGWEEVESRLEAVSGGDPDRDAAYFATQALKPKWVGDSPKRV